MTELVKLLGVSKQAAMQARGLLVRVPDPDDRRVKVLRLTGKGRKVRRAALAASHGMEQELRTDLGDVTVDELRRGLETLLAPAWSARGCPGGALMRALVTRSAAGRAI